MKTCVRIEVSLKTQPKKLLKRKVTGYTSIFRGVRVDDLVFMHLSLFSDLFHRNTFLGLILSTYRNFLLKYQTPFQDKMADFNLTPGYTIMYLIFVRHILMKKNRRLSVMTGRYSKQMRNDFVVSCTQLATNYLASF